MISIKEQIKAVQISLKGIDHELKNESIFPPVKRELVRRKQCLEDTIQTLRFIEPILEAYAEIDQRINP
ncbi:MAG: hypothetical protein HQM13_12870 [SAR324 cluster bacterium]|nr:hypothetical protein [SAR324 cluster bacterium]